MCYLISIIICLLVLALPNSSIGKELERGGATLGIDHLIMRSESGSFTTNDFETDLYVNLWQNTVNFGRLELDARYAMIETDWDPDAWSAVFAVKDLYVGTQTLMDLMLGDTYFGFRTIPQFFSNNYLPSANIRGINSVIWSDPWKLKYFFGWYANRKGFLGDIYQRTDQMIYGFNFSVDLPRKSFVGLGYLRTQNEKDFQDNLIVRNNNIFLADARIGIYGDLNLIGEYLHSFYDSVGSGKINDFSIMVGPSYITEKALVEANYRKMGKDFRFINNSTQTVTNQEGVFLRGNLNVREEHKIYLYGSSDYYWSDPLPGSGRNRLYTLATYLGATFYPTDNYFFTNTFNVIKRNASGATNPIDDLTYNASLGMSASLAKKKINAYTRLQYSESRVHYPYSNISRYPDVILGVNWNTNRHLSMNFQGEVKKNWDTKKFIDYLTSTVTYYLYWQPLSTTSLNPHVEYIRTDDSIIDRTGNALNLGLNYIQQFHRGWRMWTSVIWEKNFGVYASSYLNAHVNVEKTFGWGRPVLRKGVFYENVPLVTGNIEGYVFVDENNDGLRQPWEKGIPNIPIKIGEMFVEYTDGKGKYKFENVLIGKQTVEVMEATLDMKYNLAFHSEKVDVKLRQTTELNFPVKIMQ